MLLAHAANDRKAEFAILAVVSSTFSFVMILQKMNGTILHLPSKACFPNLRSYHSYVP